MYDTLLFFHVLSAFALAAAIVMFTAYVHGVSPTSGAFALASRLEDIGGLGTLALGIWLALYVDAYRIYDGWIIAAIVLWVLATGTGSETSKAVRTVVEGRSAAVGSRAATMHWLRTLVVVALLAVMIFKPGA